MNKQNNRKKVKYKYSQKKKVFDLFSFNIDKEGQLVVKYKYNAWGDHSVTDGNNKVNTSDTFIGNINPMRYKGYYYDKESRTYYCKSRYYVLEWCRWLNADHTVYLDVENINGMNLFSYCQNNPVNYKQRPVSSGDSITDSALSGTLCGWFMPIINSSSGGSSIFNSVLANGSFRNGLFFGKGTVTGLYASGHARVQISLKKRKICTWCVWQVFITKCYWSNWNWQ